MTAGSLVITGGRVLSPEGWLAGDVFIASGRIVSAGPDVRTNGTGGGRVGGSTETGTAGAGAERAHSRPTAVNDAAAVVGARAPAAGGGAPALDATDLVVVPGFIDLQCNGAVGVDVSHEPERLWEVAVALPRWGVTAWLPTVVTAPSEIRMRALAAVRAGPPADLAGAGRVAAEPLGLHFEGPFLAPERRGAHAETLLRSPDPALVAAEGWTREAGVAMVTLAPELPGALDLVRALAAAGVVVSAGHSSASAEQATAAIDAGVRWVTHVFNAMAPLHHRAPGVAGVALTDERVRVGVIADGLHLHPATVALVARAVGDRLCLVTDAVAALGMAAGHVHRGVRLADGTLAGSDLSLDRAVRNLMAFAGTQMADAVAAVTATPSAVLGLEERGVIAPGAVGDVVLLDPAGEVVATVIAGRVAYDRRESSAGRSSGRRQRRR
jgi:N-acetylglucosamine-6-phosphate deacetylase